MADHTGIEWTDATWNPVVGCSVVSPGCTNCYAMGQARRIGRMTEGRTGNPADTHYFGTVQVVKGKPVWTGKVALAPDDILTQPLRWKKPRRIFVNSMGDLFHEEVPDEWIDRVFAVMALSPQHTFQVLTKRSGRMREYFQRTFSRSDILTAAKSIAAKSGTSYKQLYDDPPRYVARWPLPNVWLGVSAEDQARADQRIPDLLATPAAVRFVSAEPLLGAINFRYLQPGDPPVEIDALNGTHGVLRPHAGRSERLDWIIVGGESGPGARPMHPDWARSIRDQCAAAHVPFFFKQWGEWAPGTGFEAGGVEAQHWNVSVSRFVAGLGERTHRVVRLGKQRAGRLLDGRTHDGMPEAAP